MASPILVLSTASSRKEALKIADVLLTKRLAACVNIVPSVTSLYWWKGRKEKASEVLLLIKTKKSAFKKMELVLRKSHSYTIPEMIALPMSAGSKPYLKWMFKEIDTRLSTVL